MNSVNDGGPAFPGYVMEESGDKVNITKLHPGMTLRDYFAAKAMVEDMNRPLSLWQRIRGLLGLKVHIPRCDDELAAANAYKRADAMLAARESGGGK